MSKNKSQAIFEHWCYHYGLAITKEEQMSIETIDEAVEIIRELVAELKRHDVQWGSKSYSKAVQFLRKIEDQREQSS